ncbi:hypothetical protein KSB_79700 [Ktedonobacter robiniae]|uniref:Uncharacterized protein n=1 Tax=Ktedonobacter robiniae TaxID=2778365 RepID=A0ABQ3V4H9_9CHLR|nr:hypothetical protein KSB_79700 [Ktedonobacter robiniae]
MVGACKPRTYHSRLHGQRASRTTKAPPAWAAHPQKRTIPGSLGMVLSFARCRAMPETE